MIAREWSYLDPVRSLCELEGIPVQLASEEFTGVWRLRETRALLNWLTGTGKLEPGDRCNDLNAWARRSARSVPGWSCCGRASPSTSLETGGAETPVDHFVERLAEWGREVAPEATRDCSCSPPTAPRAWSSTTWSCWMAGGTGLVRAEDADAPRRLYYVAMTRARKTLDS